MKYNKVPVVTVEPAEGSSTLSFGSSAIGPVDVLLGVHANAGLQFKDIAIGMRARTGECLMHSYSFHGSLRLNVVYDEQLGTELIKKWQKRCGKLLRQLLPDRRASL